MSITIIPGQVIPRVTFIACEDCPSRIKVPSDKARRHAARAGWLTRRRSGVTVDLCPACITRQMSRPRVSEWQAAKARRLGVAS